MTPINTMKIRKILFLCCAAFGFQNLWGATATWNLNANGNWNTNANWTPAIFPNASGDVANFFNIITANRTISLGQNIIIGTTAFDSSFNYLIIGVNSLTFQVPAGSANINITNANGNGTHTISSNTVVNSNLNVNHSSPSSFTLSGTLSGASPLTKSGTGTLVLGGSTANTFSGLITINGGNIQLNKTGAVNALVGSAQINSTGTLQLLGTSQTGNSSSITLNGGTFDLNANAATIGSLVFNSGTLTQAGATLSLASSSNALTMGNATTISGPVTISGAGTGDVIYNGTTTRATISGPLNMGAGTRTFNIANGTDTIDMEISGVISSGAFNKTTGTGVLQFSGTSANTLSGTSSISAGELILNKTAGVNAIGILTISSGGTVSLAAAEQFANTSTVTLNGGTFNLNGNDETIATLIFNSGTVQQGVGILNLTSGSATALTMGTGTSLSGPLAFLGLGSGITYNGITTRATISGDVSFPGTNSHSFNIANGADSVDMEISGAISGGGSINKTTGTGVLLFSGSTANTFSGSLSVNAGELRLGKPAGVTAINGAIFINTGGTVTLLNTEQISDTAGVTLSGGTFDLGGFNEAVSSLTFNSGTLSQGGATLTLTTNSTALTLGNGISIAGNLAFTGSGSVMYSGTTLTSTLSGNIDLGASNHSFNVGNGSATPDMLISGVISSTGGGLSKVAAGRLELSGSSANTYTGVTTVSAGQLFLNKTSGINAIPANATINGGSLILGASEQISNTSAVTLSSGTFDLAGFNETIGILTYNGGTFSQGGGLLSLTNAVTALTMRNTTINGNLSITNGGSIVFDNTSNGTATINGNIDLNATTPSFNIANGTASTDMLVNGVISNGGVTKEGPGLLYLAGPNTYASGTFINNGTVEGDTISLQGNIVDNASLIFNQINEGTYTGVLNGAGAMTKVGGGRLIFTNVSSLSGLTDIVEGSFIVNGVYGGGGTLIVRPNGLLGGNGTIVQNSIIFGTLSPGNSIDTIHLTGAQILASGSMLDIEVTPLTSDLVDITGTLTIQPAVTLNVEPVPGDYSTPQTHLIVHTTGGVTGTFSTVTSSLPLFSPLVIYTPTEIFLQGLFSPFSSIFSSGNTGAVAHCLDGLPSPPGSDLAFVINQLRLLPTLEDIKDALEQLQPSAFTSLAIAQENTTLYVKDAIFNRLDERLHSCRDQSLALKTFWTAPLGGFSYQKNHQGEPGFNTKTVGFVSGADYALTPLMIFGADLAYTYTKLSWHTSRGDSSINSVYGSLYGRWQNPYLYIQGNLMGNWNLYHIKRKIEFKEIDRNAKSRSYGGEFTASLKAGLTFPFYSAMISPFVSSDFIYLHQDKFNERGAKSLNLKVLSQNYHLWTSELGLDLSRCYKRKNKNWNPFLQVSVLHEDRFSNSHLRASLDRRCSMHVSGLAPNRTLGCITVGLNASNQNALGFLSIYYKGRYGTNNEDHSLYLDLAF